MRGSLLVLVLLAAPLSGCTTGETLTVTSPTVQPGEAIPRQHTCDGPETSPPLAFGEIPEDTVTIAVVVDDPDAGETPFVHWLVWNVPVSGGSAHLPEDTVPSGAREGANSAGSIGYAGPCPPRGDGAHTYRFTGFAIDRSLELDEGAKRAALEEAMDGHVLGQGRLSATYDR